MTDEEVFEAHRELLFAVAYRMLGTVADAEDAVQDAWLRWSAAPRSDIAEPRAYLARTVTHVALNRLRSARARREAYVGPWLPEPLLTTGPDTADRAELAESVSLAMLVVLESLTPEERAVFVLHEVFGFPHAEIAAAIGRSDASVRQLMHRAREHVQARRPRFDVDAGPAACGDRAVPGRRRGRRHRPADDGPCSRRHADQRRRGQGQGAVAPDRRAPPRWPGSSRPSPPSPTWASSPPA